VTDLAELSHAWQAFGCGVCGQVARVGADPGWTIELHHLKPRSQGGGDEPENLMGLCGELLANKCHWRVTTNRLKLERDEKHGWLWVDTRSGETGLCRPLILEIAAETGLDRHLTASVETRKVRSLERRPIPPERVEAFAAGEGFNLTGVGMKGAEDRFLAGRTLIARAERAWMALAVVLQKGAEMGDFRLLGFGDPFEWGEAMGVNKATMSKLRTIGQQFAGRWELLPDTDKQALSMEGLYIAARMVKIGAWDEKTALSEAVAQPAHKLFRTYQETKMTGTVPNTASTERCPTCHGVGWVVQPGEAPAT